MNLFNKLPGFIPSPPGLEHVILRRLPAIALWGSLLPLALTHAHRVLAELQPSSFSHDKDVQLFEYAMVGVLLMNCMLVLALGLGCFIVRVMKGPAYVADAYLLPEEDAAAELH